MRTVSATEAKSKLSDLLSSTEYNQERIIIERSGRPAAVLISVGDLAFLEEVEDRLASYEIEKALKKTKRSRPIEQVIVDYEKKHKIQLIDLKGAGDGPDK
ncbi:MAG TPA: type II toxin-antitoxin system Phd/YefM family antitoxin [Patescibacteria group bacterium]|jgi:prevent-host-death family protein|uniref:type II toxin-antitoxin system Phd/YefM family antitoxin n=1 Tax=Candidatus Methylomirabilis sp. TaxID=2032687 RepID=UPI002A6370B6|nr:type II toxin-antitoxin system Phd/YefM family antitoxin [Candidatus Methylomirabilis sp.]HWQ69668.1 type II toxin-antitoxin system Phd/YefM family antitoxin [Patescibacteria group bacterium]